MRRKSSPGTYSRCCTNSTDWPKYGLRCRPARNPSTILRARTSNREIREISSGCKNLRESRVTGQIAFLGRSRLEQTLDDAVRRHPVTFGGEVGHDPVPQH